MCDVLVIEDDDLTRHVVVEVLRDDGLFVIGVATLMEASAVLLERGTCRVLLVDHDLGEGANGFEFARECPAEAVVSGTIFMTGRRQALATIPPSERERHLAKPFRSAELLGSVRELVAA